MKGEPVLTGDAAAQFAKEAAELPADETPAETPAASATPEPKTEPAAATPAAGAKAPETPAGEEAPVPRAQYLEEIAKREKALADAQGQIEERAKAQTRSLLEQIAVQYPELKEAIYGKQPPAEKPPDDPVQRELYDIKKELAQAKAWRETQEKSQILDRIEAACEQAMEKFPEFKTKQGRAIGDQIIAHNVLANREKTPEKIVEETALLIRAYQEETKAAFKEGKTKAAATVPTGTGTGGAAPPGTPPGKLRMEDGSARRALAQALAAASKASE